jgi:hypothetical protein
VAENYIECLKNELFILFIFKGGVNTAFWLKPFVGKDYKNEQKMNRPIPVHYGRHLRMNRFIAGLLLIFLYGIAVYID